MSCSLTEKCQNTSLFINNPEYIVNVRPIKTFVIERDNGSNSNLWIY